MTVTDYVLTTKPTMSVLIDKSICPHASGQQTAMHVRQPAPPPARQPVRPPDPRPRPPPALITHMHGCLLSRCMRTDRLVDEDGHGEVDRQYDPNSVDELNMP